jgi:IrrE N-terminal-like domain
LKGKLMTDTTTETLTKYAVTIIREALHYQGGFITDSRHYPGTPPDGYWNRTRTLLATRGYTLAKRIIRKNTLTGGTLNGYATGPLHYKEPRRVVIARRMDPARQFNVLAHEAAHVILRHPPETPQQAEIAYLQQTHTKKVSGIGEVLSDEIPAELAACIVLKTVGMEIPPTSLHYLRVRLMVKPVLSQAALARVIASAVVAAQALIPVMT